MKTFLILIFFVLSAFPQKEKLNIAVMDLEGNGIPEIELAGLSNRLRTELFKTKSFFVIERSQMNEILKEQGFQQTGCTSTECAVQAGQLIGVAKIIVGSVDKVGELYSVSIRIVDVATGKVDNSIADDCDQCRLEDVMTVTIHNAARQLSGLEPDLKVERKPQTQLAPVTSEMKPQTTEGIREWEEMGMSRQDWIEFKNSGLTLNQWRSLNKPGRQALLSTFGFGFGHFGNKNYGQGSLFMISEAGSVIWFIQSWIGFKQPRTSYTLQELNLPVNASSKSIADCACKKKGFSYGGKESVVGDISSTTAPNDVDVTCYYASHHVISALLFAGFKVFDIALAYSGTKRYNNKLIDRFKLQSNLNPTYPSNFEISVSYDF